jgi:TolB-like protein
MNPSAPAVFLSYASEDMDAALRIVESLRAAGIEVWLDRSELRGGDAWDRAIRAQIHDCALFIPVVSQRTERRGEGYFRLEWRLAVERAEHMADDRVFLLPVAIDATERSSARVPERFRERQWTSLPEGRASPEFIARVRALLGGATPAATARPSSDPAVSLPTRKPALPRYIGAAAGLVGIAALGAYLALHRTRPPAGPDAHTATRTADATAQVGVKSIVVLPFQNLTGRSEDAYLADGMQEEILNALARMRDLKVISRTSAEAYRGAHSSVAEIGSRLGVGSVLEGSVRREGDTLRLTIQLIEARSDRHLLATNYDRDLRHVLGLQSEVAREVAEALGVTLDRLERGELDHVGTNNGDAYRSYLKALALARTNLLFDDKGRRAVIQQLEEAVRLDPDFADAHALLSFAHTWSYFQYEQTVDDVKAKSSYQQALAIDPQLVDGRLARGLYELYVVKDRELALADLELVAQRRPNSPVAQNSLAIVLRRLGRMDEALPYFERSWSLDPLNHIYDGGALTTYAGLRRYPEVIGQLRLHNARFPQNPMGYVGEARLTAFTQHTLEPLRAVLREHAAILDAAWRVSIEAEIASGEGRYRDAIALWEGRTDVDPINRLETVAFLHRAAGDAATAERKFRDLERLVESRMRAAKCDPLDCPQVLAIVQSMLGKHELAIASIERVRAHVPESLDPVNGPPVSFTRTIVLSRAGRTAEADAELNRLLHVPFGTPAGRVYDEPNPVLLLLEDDPRYDALIHHPPRL